MANAGAANLWSWMIKKEKKNKHILQNDNGAALLEENILKANIYK